jgi:hypothetical protein
MTLINSHALQTAAELPQMTQAAVAAKLFATWCATGDLALTATFKYK